jgi:hypothetical protein
MITSLVAFSTSRQDKIDIYTYKYDGKEHQDDLGLNITVMDYHQYDSAIGGFNSIDVLSELSSSITFSIIQLKRR